MKLKDIRKGISIFEYVDRGVTKVSIIKIIDGNTSGKIVRGDEYVWAFNPFAREDNCSKDRLPKGRSA